MPLALLAAAALAAAAAAPTSSAFSVPVEERVLANGLRVALAPDSTVPGVAVCLWFDVGSADERPGRTGFAHLFEHLMFMGSTHAPYPAFDELMERRGGTNNAFTASDETVYFEVGPANLLPLFLWLEADRLWTLPDVMTAEKVKAQRLVVRNERRQSYENRPYRSVELALPGALWPAGHPYSWPGIGAHADLEAASDDDVRAFFRRNYLPSNASLVIAGDFAPAEAASLVERYFGWMPGSRRPERPPVEPAAGPPPSPGVRLEDAVAAPKAVLAWRSPPRCAPADAALDVASRILVNGNGGRLHRALVYERRAATKVEADQRSQRLQSLFVVGAIAQPGHGSDELAAALDAALAELATAGPTAAEVEAARSVVLTELALRLEGLVERSIELQRAVACTGSAAGVSRVARLYEEVTPESVRAAVAGMRAGGSVRVAVEPRAGEVKP